MYIADASTDNEVRMIRIPWFDWFAFLVWFIVFPIVGGVIYSIYDSMTRGAEELADSIDLYFDDDGWIQSGYERNRWSFERSITSIIKSFLKKYKNPKEVSKPLFPFLLTAYTRSVLITISVLCLILPILLSEDTFDALSVYYGWCMFFLIIIWCYILYRWMQDKIAWV